MNENDLLERIERLEKEVAELRILPGIKGGAFKIFIKSVFKKGNVFIGIIISLVIATAAISALTKPYTFSPGALISTSQINSNFDALYTAVNTITTPIGSIIAWHKSLTGTPVLPDGWVECNGQTLNDPVSLYNGQIIPNLNGDAGTGDGGRFLRGNTNSGLLQVDSFKSHSHNIRCNANNSTAGTAAPYSSSVNWTYTNIDDCISNGGTETRPVNMSIVWIMRVK